VAEEVWDFAAANNLYKVITGRHAGSTAELIELPFALGLRLEDEEDIEEIAALSNHSASEGMYIDQCTLAIESVDSEEKPLDTTALPDHFPLLLILQEEMDPVLVAHEMTHNVDAAIRAAFTTLGYERELWGNDFPSAPDAVKRAEGIEQSGDGEAARTFAIEALEAALVETKHEILAQFSAKGSFTHILTFFTIPRVNRQLMDTTEAKQGLLQKKGVSPQLFPTHRRQQYNEFVDQYNEVLARNVMFLRQLWGLAKMFGSTSIDDNAMLTFMRLTPLAQWQSVGVRYFRDEWKRLNRLRPAFHEHVAEWKERLTGYAQRRDDVIRLFGKEPYSYYRWVLERPLSEDEAFLLEYNKLDSLAEDISEALISLDDGTSAQLPDIFDPDSLLDLEILIQKGLRQFAQERRRFEQKIVERGLRHLIA
jgi:hypothetical protein